MKWILVLLVLYSLYQGQDAAVVEGGCPFGFIRYYDSDRCYYISKSKANFTRARDFCRRWNAELVPPLTCRAELHLAAVLQSDSYIDQFWIGVTKLDDKSNWTSTEHVEIPQSNQFWERDYPKGSGNCVFMSFIGNWRMGEWRNADCALEKDFVCITCPDDFDYVSEVNDCLRLNKNLLTWKQARKACRKMKWGSHLVSIENKAKQKAVKRYLLIQSAGKDSEVCVVAGTNITTWTGGQALNTAKCDGVYTWRQGRAFDGPFNYTNWKKGLPSCDGDNANATCVKITDVDNFQWLQSNCATQFCSVCEFD